MKINQILNEFSEGAQPGVATTAAQTPQAQAAAQAIQKGLAVLQQQSPNFDASFNTTDAIQEIMPDGTVVMDSNLQPSALQNVRKILALGGGANFKVTMSTQTIPSATGQQVAIQAKPGVAEGDRPFRGVGGAFDRGDDEQHDLDPTDWYIVKDGKMLVASIYPRQVQQAIAQGFSRTRAEAKSRANSQGVAEDSLNELSSALLQRAAQTATDKRNQAMDPKLHDALGGGYMNPLAQHYDDVSQKINNRAGQVRKKETIQNIASKIASPAVMRKMGMSGVAEGNLKEFAPGSGGGESGRWYTDDQITDLVGDGWYQDLDVSGDIPKQQMIQQAQAWLDDQGYSVEVLNCRVNDDDMEWYMEGTFYNPQFAKKGVAEAGNANSGRRGPDYQDNSPVVPGRVEHLPQGLRHHADASRYGGTEPDDEDDRLLGPQQRHRLHRAVTPDDLDEQEKIAGRHDPDDFDDMIGRLKKLAGAGPLKTVWDPAKRVYKNVPHAVQPAQQPKKAPQ